MEGERKELELGRIEEEGHLGWMLAIAGGDTYRVYRSGMFWPSNLQLLFNMTHGDKFSIVNLYFYDQ